MNAKRDSKFYDLSEIIFTDYSKAYKVGYEDMQRRIPDISKINTVIGWKPNINLETTIKDIYES